MMYAISSCHAANATYTSQMVLIPASIIKIGTILGTNYAPIFALSVAVVVENSEERL